MFEKDIIAIDISRECISILVGTKYKINNGVTLETPKDSFDNDSIQDVELLAGVIGPQVKKAKTKDVSFVLRGEDIITRHMNIPLGKEEAMRDSVDFELRQFIGERVDEYYFDYQITSYDKNSGNGKCDVLIVACEKKKIDSYMELAKKLKLNVKSIDIYANVVARVFSSLKQSVNKGIKSIGVVNVDSDSNSLEILEWGKLVLEKYQYGGIYQASNKGFSNMMEYNKILDRVDLVEAKEAGEESEVEMYFHGLVQEFNTLIQYYTSGKIKKSLDRIYVIGTATKIRGLEQYLEVNLNTRVAKTPIYTDLKFSVKAPKKVYLKDYLMPYGLLLRRE